MCERPKCMYINVSTSSSSMFMFNWIANTLGLLIQNMIVLMGMDNQERTLEHVAWYIYLFMLCTRGLPTFLLLSTTLQYIPVRLDLSTLCNVYSKFSFDLGKLFHACEEATKSELHIRSLATKYTFTCVYVYVMLIYIHACI